ncbi:hypothetical protein [Shewanella sp. 0m-4]
MQVTLEFNKEELKSDYISLIKVGDTLPYFENVVVTEIRDVESSEGNRGKIMVAEGILTSSVDLRCHPSMDLMF